MIRPVGLVHAKRCVVMSIGTNLTFGGTVAILCAATALSIIVLAGIRIGDRAIQKSGDHYSEELQHRRAHYPSSNTKQNDTRGPAHDYQLLRIQACD